MPRKTYVWFKGRSTRATTAATPEVFDAAYHPDAVVWNNGRRLEDGPILEGFRRDLLEYDQQFSEWRIEVENWIGRIQNGKVAEVWEATDE